MKLRIEVIRAKDNLKKSCESESDGTETDLKKCINSYDLFYKTRQFKAYKITDEFGNVLVKKGNI